MKIWQLDGATQYDRTDCSSAGVANRLGLHKHTDVKNQNRIACFALLANLHNLIYIIKLHYSLPSVHPGLRHVV